MALHMVSGKLLAGVGVAAVAVILLLGSGLAWQTYQLGQAQQSLGETGQKHADCLDANRHQTEQLAICRRELTDIIRRLAVNEREISRRLIERERELADRDQALARARADRQALYERLPECAELARAELCPATDARIRAQLERLQQGP